MPRYDSNLFYPPAPVTKVTLRDPSNGNIASNILMLIDSGADITLVPKASIDKLESTLDPVESYRVEAFDGPPSVAQSLQLY